VKENTMGIIIAFFVLLFFIGLMILGLKDKVKDSRTTNEQKAENEFGLLNIKLICPHCQTRGSVRTKPIILKKGISGGKATAAILTGGVSLVATGLSKKHNQTQAHCMHCGSTWDY
jgi:hypothetical protein